MNAPTTAWQDTLRWDRAKDKYGRSCHYLKRGHRTLGVAVTLPKRTRRDGDPTHLSNDWQPTDRSDAVRYHDSLKAAKLRLLALVQA